MKQTSIATANGQLQQSQSSAAVYQKQITIGPSQQPPCSNQLLTQSSSGNMNLRVQSSESIVKNQSLKQIKTLKRHNLNSKGQNSQNSSPQGSPAKHNFEGQSKSSNLRVNPNAYRQKLQTCHEEADNFQFNLVSIGTSQIISPSKIAHKSDPQQSTLEKTKFSQYNQTSPSATIKHNFRPKSTSTKDGLHQKNLISLKKVKCFAENSAGAQKQIADSRTLSTKKFASNSSNQNSQLNSPKETSDFKHLVQENRKLKENIMMLTKLIQEVVPAFTPMDSEENTRVKQEQSKLRQNSTSLNTLSTSKSRTLSQNHFAQLQQSIQQLQSAYLQKQDDNGCTTELDSTFLEAEDLNSSSIDERILDSTPLSKQKSQIDFNSSSKHPNFQTFGGLKNDQDAFLLSFRDQLSPPLTTGQRVMSHSGQKKTKMSDLNKQSKNFNMPISLDLVKSKKKIIDYEGVRQLQGMIESINMSEILQELKLIQPHTFKLKLKSDFEQSEIQEENQVPPQSLFTLSRNQQQLYSQGMQNVVLDQNYSSASFSANGDSSISDDEIGSIPADSILHKQLVNEHQTIQKMPLSEMTNSHNNLQNTIKLIHSNHHQNKRVLNFRELQNLNIKQSNQRPNFKQEEQFYPKIMIQSGATATQNFFSCTSVESVNDNFSPKNLTGKTSLYQMKHQEKRAQQNKGQYAGDSLQKLQEIESEQLSLEVTHQIKIGPEEIQTTNSDQSQLHYEIVPHLQISQREMFDAQNQSSQNSQINVDISMVGSKLNSNQISVLVMAPPAAEESHDNTRFELDIIQQATPLGTIKEEVSCSYENQEPRLEAKILPSPQQMLNHHLEDITQQTQSKRNSGYSDNSQNSTLQQYPLNQLKRQSVDPILVNLMRNESPLKLKDQIKTFSAQEESIQQSYRQEIKETMKDFEQRDNYFKEKSSSSKKPYSQNRQSLAMNPPVKLNMIKVNIDDKRRKIQNNKENRAFSARQSPQKLNSQEKDLSKNYGSLGSKRVSLGSNRKFHNKQTPIASSCGNSPHSISSNAHKVSSSQSNQILDESVQAKSLLRQKSISNHFKSQDFSKAQQVNLKILSDSTTKPFEMIQNKWVNQEEKERNLVELNKQIISKIEESKLNSIPLIKEISLRPQFQQQERSMEMLKDNLEPQIVMSEPDEPKLAKIVDNQLFQVSPAQQIQIQSTSKALQHPGFKMGHEKDSVNMEMSSFCMTIVQTTEEKDLKTSMNQVIELERVQCPELTEKEEDNDAELTIENFEFQQIICNPKMTESSRFDKEHSTSCPVIQIKNGNQMQDQSQSCRRDTLLLNQPQSAEISFNQTFNAFNMKEATKEEDLSPLTPVIKIEDNFAQAQNTIQHETEIKQYLQDYDLQQFEVIEEIKELDKMSTPSPRNLREELEEPPHCQTTDFANIESQRKMQSHFASQSQFPSQISVDNFHDLPELREYTQESLTYKNSQLDHMASEYLREMNAANGRQSIRSCSRSNNRSVSPNHFIKSQYSSCDLVEVSAPDLGQYSSRKGQSNMNFQQSTSSIRTQAYIATQENDEQPTIEIVPSKSQLQSARQGSSMPLTSAKLSSIHVYESTQNIEISKGSTSGLSSSSQMAMSQSQSIKRQNSPQIQSNNLRESYSPYQNNNTTIREEPSFEEQDSSQLQAYLERHSNSVLQSQRLNLIQQQLTESQMTSHTYIEDADEINCFNKTTSNTKKNDLLEKTHNQKNTEEATQEAEQNQQSNEIVQTTEEVSLTQIDMAESEMFSNFMSNKAPCIDENNEVSQTQIYLSIGHSSVDKADREGFSSNQIYAAASRGYVNLASCSSKQSSPNRDSLLRKHTMISSCKNNEVPQLKSQLLSPVLQQDRSKQSYINLSKSIQNMSRVAQNPNRQNHNDLSTSRVQKDRSLSNSKSKSRERSISNNAQRAKKIFESIASHQKQLASPITDQRSFKVNQSAQKIQAAKERREKLEQIKSEQLMLKMELKNSKVANLFNQQQSNLISINSLYQGQNIEQDKLARLSIDSAQNHNVAKSVSKTRLKQIQRPQSNTRPISNTVNGTPVNSSNMNLQLRQAFSIPTKQKITPQIFDKDSEAEEQTKMGQLRSEKRVLQNLESKINDKEERVRHLLERKLQIESRINQRKTTQANANQQMLIINEQDGEGCSSSTQDDHSEQSISSSRTTTNKRHSLTRGNLILVRTPSQGLQQKMVLKNDQAESIQSGYKRQEQKTASSYKIGAGLKNDQVEILQLATQSQQIQLLGQAQSMKNLKKFSSIINQQSQGSQSSKLSVSQSQVQAIVNAKVSLGNQGKQDNHLASQERLLNSIVNQTNTTSSSFQNSIHSDKNSMRAIQEGNTENRQFMKKASAGEIGMKMNSKRDQASPLLVKLQPKTSAANRSSQVHSRIEQLSQR